MGQTNRPARPRGEPDDRRPANAVPDDTVQERRDGSSVVIDVTGTFATAVRVANSHLLLALSTDPTTVRCDLTGVTGVLDEQVLVELLESGGLLEHWPGTEVILVTEQRVDDLLLARYAGGAAVRIDSGAPGRRAAVEGGATEPQPADRPRAQIHLDPHPMAARTARDFVSRTCLDWQLAHGIGAAALVVSELVTNALTHAGSALDVAVTAADGQLLLGVHDRSDDPPLAPPPRSGQSRNHGLHLVAGFSRAWGWLPRPDGGKVVWAVLDT
jgi:hypothetical protein